MSESTLTLRLSDFSAEVGNYLGYGRGADFGEPKWSTKQQGLIDSCVRSGLRQFYFPPRLPNEPTAYDWSFLHPTTTAVFAEGTSIIPMLDDFGGFEGELTLVSDSSRIATPVPLVGEGIVREQYALRPDATGFPQYASIQPLGRTNPNHSPRKQLYLWPIADQDYTLAFQYYLLPDALTGDRPYAYGGAAHTETILESCLAIAEQRFDDTQGVHSAKFMERLAASINHDRKLKPQRLGYNGDYSDRVPFRRQNVHGLSSVTYNGTLY